VPAYGPAFLAQKYGNLKSGVFTGYPYESPDFKYVTSILALVLPHSAINLQGLWDLLLRSR
jgi:hypothetical protein